MRQNPNNRRARGGRNSRKPHVPLKNQTFESNGGEIRIRGNAFQVLERYLSLARDAASAGDRVAAENYLQHAEHYHRIIHASDDNAPPRLRPNRELSADGWPDAAPSNDGSVAGLQWSDSPATEAQEVAPPSNPPSGRNGNSHRSEATGGPMFDQDIKVPAQPGSEVPASLLPAPDAPLDGMAQPARNNSRRRWQDRRPTGRGRPPARSTKPSGASLPPGDTGQEG